MTMLSKESNVGLYSKENSRKHLLSRITVLRERERDLIDALVPFDLIRSEGVPVDWSHVRNLQESIRKEKAGGKESGQLSSLLCGHVNGSMVFDIIDGFHRFEALKELGEKGVITTIKFNCAEENILDLRILAAVSHKSVNFARTIEWSQKAWDLSPWSKKLKITQAFDLRFSERKLKFGLSDSEVEEIRKWIDDKCKAWGVHAPTLRQYLVIAETADPQLIKSVRFRAGGSERIGSLSVVHLKEIAKALSNNFEFQNIVARKVLEKQLHVRKAKELARAISHVKTAEEAMGIIEKILQKTNEPHVSTASSEKKEKESTQIEKLKEELFAAETRIARFFLNSMVNREDIIKNQASDEKAMRIIKKAVLDLPSKFRTAFILQKIYNLSVPDIAKVSKKTENDVLGLIQNIREIIKKIDPLTESTLFAENKLQPVNKQRISEESTVIKVSPEQKVVFDRNAKTVGRTTMKVVEELKPAKVKNVSSNKIYKDDSIGHTVDGKPVVEKVVPIVKPVKDNDKGDVKKEPHSVEHLERKPEDFNKGGRIVRRKDGVLGVINGVGKIDEKYYVSIRVDGINSKIPIIQFDNTYSLATQDLR